MRVWIEGSSTGERGAGMRALVLALLALLWPIAANAEVLKVESIAYAPSDLDDQFLLQCGRKGKMQITVVAKIDSVGPARFAAGVEVGGKIEVWTRREYADGPAQHKDCVKLGKAEDVWLCQKLVTWEFACSQDCEDITINGISQGRGALDMSFHVGAEPAPQERDDVEQARMQPNSGAESDTLTLQCVRATPLGRAPPGRGIATDDPAISVRMNSETFIRTPPSRRSHSPSRSAVCG